VICDVDRGRGWIVTWLGSLCAQFILIISLVIWLQPPQLDVTRDWLAPGSHAKSLLPRPTDRQLCPRWTETWAALCTTAWVKKKRDAKLLPMKKVAHTRLPSVGFRSWSRFLAVSLQVMWVINLAVSNRYFSPGPQLPPQLLRGLLPVLLLGEQRHSGCEQFAQDSIATAICNLPIASTNINRFSNFLLPSLPVKEFWKSLNIWGSCGNSSPSWFFWLTVYKRPSINAILQQDCSRFICMSLHRVCAWFDFAILANKCFHSLIWSK